MADKVILVVDDEQVICNLLSVVLSEKGYKVVYTTSPVEGLKLAGARHPDIMVVDLKMPEMDGISLIRRVREFDSEMIIVVMTGYPSFDTVVESLRLGAYDYVTKPFDIGEISFVIEKAFDYRNLIIANKRLMKELEEKNAELEEKVEGRTKELSLLYNVSKDIVTSLQLDETLKVIVDRISAVLDLEICSILLFDKVSKELTIKAACGLPDDAVKVTQVKPGENISGWVLQNKEAVFVEDIETDGRFSRRNQEKYYTHSFISAPLIYKNEAIGVINVNNKRSKKSFTYDDFKLLKSIADQSVIAIENASLYTSLNEMYLCTVAALISALDAKDHYTKTHSDNVARYALAIALSMGLDEEALEDMRLACELHDLGKIGVHDYILTKPGKLNPEEIKKHSSKSAEILKPLTFLGNIIKLIEQHHERYDGKGYPHGFKGEDIELGARIIAVADSYDAMTTQRPYKKVLSREEAMGELAKNSGTQFDPMIVDVFLKILESL